MATTETRQTERVNTGVDADGAVVREQTNSVQSKAGAKMTFVNLVWYVYGVVAILLVLRLVLKLLGANSANGFVSFVYLVSGVLSKPFDSIFGVKTAEAGSTQSVFEPSIVVALVVYALIAWGIAKLVAINEK